jgi:hypothetical protein
MLLPRQARDEHPRAVGLPGTSLKKRLKGGSKVKVCAPLVDECLRVESVVEHCPCHDEVVQNVSGGADRCPGTHVRIRVRRLRENNLDEILAFSLPRPKPALANIRCEAFACFWKLHPEKRRL